MTNIGEVVTLAFWVVTLAYDMVNVEIQNSWIANSELCFKGVITIQFGRDVFEDWEIELHSSQKLSSLIPSKADISNSTNDGRLYLLTSKSWNDGIAAKGKMNVPFVACSSETSKLPQVTAEFRKNEEICPKISVSSDLQSIQVPNILTDQWDTGFRAYLNITSPTAIQGGWKIYLAFSRSLSSIDAPNTIMVPSHGNIFTLENTLLNVQIMAGVPHLIHYVGEKMNATDPVPCVRAFFTWKDDHYATSVVPSTTVSPVGSHCGNFSVPSNFNYFDVSVVILQDWPQGFTGRINIIAPSHIRDGWEIILLLKNAISSLEVYVTTANPLSGTKFTLKNMDYNKELSKGSVTAVDFKATKEKENDDIPCVSAVFMWPKEELCPTMSPVAGFDSMNATLTINERWNEGISGKISVIVPEGVKNGWQVHVSVSTPITLVVYVADSSPATGTSFTLTNKDYNEVLPAGTSFVIDFTATKQEVGSTVLCASAIFLW